MAIFFLQESRLSYAQPVLPLFRTIFVGGVLAMLALLAGFAAPGPSTMARPALPARGPLIEAAQHPEWKQFLVQAAYRRADELERLRDLPNTPTIVPPPAPAVPVPAIPVQVAALPPPQAEAPSEEITGSIEEPPVGDMEVGVGEASAVELPVGQSLRLPMPRPDTTKPDESRRKLPAHRVAKRAKPAPVKPEPDFFTRLFGGGGAPDSAPNTAAKTQQP
jgi:hypothetical protein